MKVYIAERHYDYEGFTIIGVFTTKKEAKKCCDYDCGCGDEHRVTDYEVEKKAVNEAGKEK